MIEVPAEVRRSFSLPTSPEAAFAVLQDVPTWGALFPGVAAITPLAPDQWRWDMEPMGPPRVQVRTVYGCHYTFDADALEVTWAPVPGVGNAAFSGGVRLAPEASGGDGALRARGDLWLTATLEIPAPRFVAGVVGAAVSLEFGRMTDRFLDRLAEHVRSV